MSDQKEFDYGNTGATESSGITWLQMKTKKSQPMGFFVMKGKGEEKKVVKTFKSFAGRLMDFSIDYEKPNEEHKIPGNIRILLDIWAKDEELGTDRGNGVPIAVYRVAISFSSHYMMPSVLNVLAAIDTKSWDQFIYLSLYRKSDTDNTRLFVHLIPNAPQGYRPETKYAWNEEDNRGFIGVPKPIATGVFVDGVEVLQWHEPNNFWLKEAIDFAQRFTGQPYSGPKGKYTVKGWEFDEQQAAAPTQTAPAAQPSAPAPTTATLQERAMTNFVGRWEKTLKTEEDWKRCATETITALNKNGATKADIKTFGLNLNDKATNDSLKFTGFFVDGDWFVPTGATSKPAPEGDDDLPF